MADFDNGLLSISLDSDSDADSTGTPAECATSTPSRADRTALSDAAFQHLKETYKPKVENGEIWSTITFPIGTSKPEAQEVLHAAEELYFFRRYEEAVRFVERVFSGSDGKGEHSLDEDTKRLLKYYAEKAWERVGAKTQNGDDGGRASISS
ncbi:hypothetical protein QBC34DRAFT_399766 [Podospora aff. communis PSN243]|uniref:Uncharacterized protein n=1 Tax=Podospora aff. communis PSN243 TaxID=3040156 RepID=A0AAV9GWR0_9PEZI|nr:hypothetical protein QBC34DRAFT_399766 [Podospora aff. communis PSN243]